jgi:hypothetical protein
MWKIVSELSPIQSFSSSYFAKFDGILVKLMLNISPLNLKLATMHKYLKGFYMQNKLLRLKISIFHFV